MTIAQTKKKPLARDTSGKVSPNKRPLCYKATLPFGGYTRSPVCMGHKPRQSPSDLSRGKGELVRRQCPCREVDTGLHSAPVPRTGSHCGRIIDLINHLLLHRIPARRHPDKYRQMVQALGHVLMGNPLHTLLRNVLHILSILIAGPLELRRRVWHGRGLPSMKMHPCHPIVAVKFIACTGRDRTLASSNPLQRTRGNSTRRIRNSLRCGLAVLRRDRWLDLSNLPRCASSALAVPLRASGRSPANRHRRLCR